MSTTGSAVGDLRAPFWESARNRVFDVAIIGGGINGASIYHELCLRGHSVVLVDKGDFSCGTSQASAMMIWGGLLYLRNLDFRTVIELSRARDAAIEELASHVRASSFQYIPAAKGGRNRHHVYMALYLYWLLGGMRRKRPSVEEQFSGLSLLGSNSVPLSLCYEEAMLRESDCRFVLQWITPFRSDREVPLNYCALTGGEYNRKDSLWHLRLEDRMGDHTAVARARVVLNCAGVWADEVNRLVTIDSPYKHALSKGVFVGLRRAENHVSPMIFEMAHEGDVLSLIPWGPLSLWGPTETRVDRPKEGFTPHEEDIHFLLRHASVNLASPITSADIVSIRCGVRPLAVKKSYDADCYPLDLSRKSVIVEDGVRPWLTVYGGKLTGASSVAKKAAARVQRRITPKRRNKPANPREHGPIDYESFPGLDLQVPSIEWCARNEFCCTIEDYLRRRTNISQWVPREGLGREGGNAEHVLGLIERLHGQGHKGSRAELATYEEEVKIRFDHIIERL